ncbi:MAG: IS30 family transposase [Kocuria sp.]|nr:IS30 family transposase [Kocuria sp.]
MRTGDVPEGLRRQWRADRALRPAMFSPGRPQPSRTVQRDFWRLIATGISTAEAALVVGVSIPVASRWFRHAGGMPPISLVEPSGRYLSFAEREEIAILKAQGKGVRTIARALGRDPGTISRELRRNAATRGGKLEYRAMVAQWKAHEAAKRPKEAKMVTNPRLRDYVQDRLAGKVTHPDGRTVNGPDTPVWKGLNKPHRADRRWSKAWSPEQISHRLRIEFGDDESTRISHEAIYQSLFIEGRGALKRDLVTCLRTGRALRSPRERSRNKPHGHVTADVVISERPAEAADRAVPGHWEGDLIIGTGRSAIGTLVERHSRATILVHLPRLEGWGQTPPVKNGPSLGGYGAVAMNTALAASITALPQQLRKTITWDRGKELSAHATFALETGTKVYFADPHSPWQRPSNENTNGLLRQYFPKGTDLSRWTAEDLEAVAHTLNSRPRKTLGWRTPAEVFEKQLQSLEEAGVATTG